MSSTLKRVVGLFGTCGCDRGWREKAKGALDAAGIPSYNPHLPDGVDYVYEVHGVAEEDHKANDQVILFAITAKEQSWGSLGEVGFACLNAQKLGQTVVVFIEEFPNEPKSAENRARKLTRGAAKQSAKMFDNIKVGASLDEAIALAVTAING